VLDNVGRDVASEFNGKLQGDRSIAFAMRDQCGLMDKGKIAANHLGKVDQLDHSCKGHFREAGIFGANAIVGDVAATAFAPCC
jgi:3-hydroxymyristoyl/3-hydroxydecanoyl-(acyl carrier protein) dehydratase